MVWKETHRPSRENCAVSQVPSGVLEKASHFPGCELEQPDTQGARALLNLEQDSLFVRRPVPGPCAAVAELLSVTSGGGHQIAGRAAARKLRVDNSRSGRADPGIPLERF